MRVLFDDFSAYTQYQLGYVKCMRLVFPWREREKEKAAAAAAAEHHLLRHVFN